MCEGLRLHDPPSERRIPWRHRWNLRSRRDSRRLSLRGLAHEPRIPRCGRGPLLPPHDRRPRAQCAELRLDRRHQRLPGLDARGVGGRLGDGGQVSATRHGVEDLDHFDATGTARTAVARWLARQVSASTATRSHRRGSTMPASGGPWPRPPIGGSGSTTTTNTRIFRWYPEGTPSVPSATTDQTPSRALDPTVISPPGTDRRSRSNSWPPVRRHSERRTGTARRAPCPWRPERRGVPAGEAAGSPRLAPRRFLVMWRPRTLSDVEAVLGVQETAQLEFKRQLVASTAEIAKDIAAMTVEGGVIAYGIDEQGLAASSLMPIPLGGVRERIRQIADTSIQPPPALDIEIIEDAPGSGRGFAIVEVPASPLAPHMTNGRYHARSGTTIRLLSELEVARLYDQRRILAERQATRVPFQTYLRHEHSTGEVRARTAIVRLMVEPVASYRHPRGFRLHDPLEAATTDAAIRHRSLLDDPWFSRLLNFTSNTWEPHSTEGWQAGTTTRDMPEQGEYLITANATYTHSSDLRRGDDWTVQGKSVRA